MESLHGRKKLKTVLNFPPLEETIHFLILILSQSTVNHYIVMIVNHANTQMYFQTKCVGSSTIIFYYSFIRVLSGHPNYCYSVNRCHCGSITFTFVFVLCDICNKRGVMQSKIYRCKSLQEDKYYITKKVTAFSEGERQSSYIT